MKRLYLLLQYDGSLYSGSQVQRGSHCSTIQGELWRAFEALGIQFKIKRLHFASRTDKGVHALGQVAELDVSPELLDTISDFALALNSVLPPSIAVQSVIPYQPSVLAERLPSVQFEAVAKWYRYRWWISPQRSAFQRTNEVRCVQAFDVQKAHAYAQGFLGEHDFRVFQSAGSSVTNTRCLLHYMGFSQQFEEEIILDVVGNRFLYKMVRNMVAYLQQAGLNAENALPPDAFLKQSVRPYSLRTAPSQGLTLMAIHYKQPFLQFNDVRVKILSHAFNKEFSNVENLFSKTR